ncbi:MAG: methionine--tRNA ligase [Candidatus Pacebacteria bacterium]|nr:methionine--tRNA ligase [Candidatus Paceibacterota bacterium]
MDNTKSNRLYITTTLPYVNSNPHMGHALEFVRADVIARYKKLMGFDVFFNTGTDEHGQKIYTKALETGQTPQEYTDFYASKFQELLKLLGISSDVNFIRTTDPHHIKSAQEFWKTCDKNGYIYKKNYQVKYCVGCELEKSDSELVNGKCPDHPNTELEIIEEENYFFKFSAFQDKLLDFYEKNPDFVIPDFRFNEIKAFVKRGLTDFSISRLKSKMPWGIEVPGDENQVIYVWFDALVNYISSIGWPSDMEKFNKWQVETGGMVQYCGKDNLRQQSAMWQAMLMAAGLPNSKTIVIDGFVTGAGGVKMSKSIGNVVDPVEIIKDFGTDALRYYVLRELSPFEDTPCTKEMFKDAYNANLANGLGNLVSRLMTMSQNNLEKPVEIPENTITQDFKDAVESYNLQKATNIIWEKIKELDTKIQETQPFKLVKTDKEKAIEIIKDLVINLYTIGRMLNPIMPETSKIIKDLVKENKKPEKPLFLRVD